MDQIQREGNYPLPPGASHILGVEFSGVVDGLGPGVTKWSPGDEVYGLVAGVWISSRHDRVFTLSSPGSGGRVRCM